MEEAALASLYERYGYLVHRRCLALVKNRADADDALQEVFMRVQRYGQSKTEASALQWLYTIARNCCFDLMTKRGREQPGHEEDVAAADVRSHGDPTDGDRRALLGVVLQTLDAKTREIGVLHHLDGFTQEEVAVRTGYSRKTVGKKLQVFEEAIRQRFAEGS